MRLRTLSVVAGLCLVTALASAQTIEPKGEVTYPVSARIDWPAAKATEGTQPTVKVKVRNTVTEAGRHGVAMMLMAVVVRSVRWADVPATKDDKKWLAPVYGSTKKNADGTVEHNTMAQRLTELSFESGLLLPGEELTVELPAPPAGKSAGLIVSYAVVPGNFESQVLLAEPISPKGPGKVTVKYEPYSSTTARARERVRGVALVKATMDPRAKPLPVREQKLEFAIPGDH